MSIRHFAVLLLYFAPPELVGYLRLLISCDLASGKAYLGVILLRNVSACYFAMLPYGAVESGYPAQRI